VTGTELRSRWPRWPITLAVVSVIIAGGAAAVAKWPHAWRWLVVGVALAAAAVPPALAALSQDLQRRREIGRAARAGLQGTTGAVGSKLPTAASGDLEARVHQSVLPIPYVHRDVEDIIRFQLRAGHPVLLIGSSMVGKTKMAAQVVAEEFSSWPVAIPDSKTALADLDARDVTLQGSVIWLDDIDRLIGTDGITDGALRRLARAGNIIVGTIRVRAYDQFRPSDQLRPPEWDVLSVFKHVFISRDLTRQEQERLTHAVADPGIRERIRIIGLGEYVGAAMQIAEALKLGAAGTHPLGYALVLAAADWRRCGMTRPVPRSLLAPLAEPYLDRRNKAALANRDAFDTALTWATRDINPNVALLQLAATSFYNVYDYALDLISAQDTPIPQSNWAVIMADADAPELVRLGYVAEFTYHQREVAFQAWRQAASSGHAAAVPIAAMDLGAVLLDRGDLQGAKDAFQEATDSGHANAAPVGAFGLGGVLERQGDAQGGKDAYQKAIDSGHADVAPLAAVCLGNLLKRQGNVQEAKDAYQKAVNSRHAEAAPMAAFKLGGLLQGQGDIQGAKDAYQNAIDSGHPDVAPEAAVSLGLLEGHIQGT
jgi:tetratricopeptide (TPR) repeat protein